MEGQMIHTTDRISHLPEPIIHHIMSLLDDPEEVDEFDLDSPADLVRLSVLSKKWFALTASFPILNLDIRNFETRTLCPHDYYYLKYADYTTSRFCKQNVSAHTFNLIAVIEDPSQLQIIDKCVRSILKKGVKVLLIDIIDKNYSLVYLLPDLLLSASLLTSLTLCNCDLPSSLTVDDVKFKFLKLLDLDYILLNEEMIECLTISCPVLEEMHLYRCYGFKKIRIYGHQNLLKLRIDSIDGLKTIDIKAPNFSHLILKVWVEKIKRINLASCKKLTTLSFTRYSSETTQVLADFAHFLSNFPFIENLFLTLPSNCDSLKFSSHSLRTIVLHSPCDFDKFDINAPNLLLFEYCGNSHKPDSLVRQSVEPKARIEYYTLNGLYSRCFMKLRRFLNKKNEFKVFKLVSSGQKPIDVERLKAIQSPPYELERVELELEFELRSSFEVVDAVLWCFRPRSLTLKSMNPWVDFENFVLVVAFTYLKLLEQEDERQNNTYLLMSSSSIAEKHFIDLFELLAELPRDRLDQTITFIKEEVTQEEA